MTDFLRLAHDLGSDFNKVLAREALRRVDPRQAFDNAQVHDRALSRQHCRLTFEFRPSRNDTCVLQIDLALIGELGLEAILYLVASLT